MKIAIIISGNPRQWHNELCSKLLTAIPNIDCSVASLPDAISSNDLTEWGAQLKPAIIVNLSGFPITIGNLPSLVLDIGGDSTQRSWKRQAIDPACGLVLTVRDTTSGTIYVALRTGCPYWPSTRVSRATDKLYVRAADVILLGVKRLLAGTPQKECIDVDPYKGSWPGIIYRSSVKMIANLIFADKFKIYWRRIEPSAPSVIEDTAKLLAFKGFPQPAGHYYADPFLTDFKEKPYILVEDFCYRDGKGTIRAIALDNTSSTEIICESFHLSYPQVFEHKGKRYMIPESGGAKQVLLYEMAEDVTKWKKAAVLMDNIDAVDSTLHYDGKLWWLFIDTNSLGGPHGESLHLYYAEQLTGPYLPHTLNPVITDAARARPAGKLFYAGSKLIRPSQDCLHSYGAALVLNTIEMLTPTHYSERVWKRIAPPRGFNGLHHYHRVGEYEVIDMQKKYLRCWRNYRD